MELHGHTCKSTLYQACHVCPQQLESWELHPSKSLILHDVDVINLQIGGFLVVDPCPVSHLSTLARDSAARQEQGQHHQHPHHDCSTHYVNTTSESILHRLARAVPPERRGCETIKGKKRSCQSPKHNEC